MTRLGAFAELRGYRLEIRLYGAVEILNAKGETVVVAVPDEYGRILPGCLYIMP